jgi:hypothetical protein
MMFVELPDNVHERREGTRHAVASPMLKVIHTCAGSGKIGNIEERRNAKFEMTGLFAIRQE